MTTKAYLFIWKIDVGDIVSEEIPNFLNSFKSFEEKLQDLLNSEVVVICVPFRGNGDGTDTRLEIHEFFPGQNKSFTSNVIQNPNQVEDLIQFLKEIK